MSVSGMKKQLHKASQMLSERLMGAEGTRMDEDFLKMEKSVTVIHTLLVELLSRTTVLLQPNAAHRARLSMLSTMSRIRGQERTSGYPQTESMLGDCMLQYSQQLGSDSEFGGALADVGASLLQVAQARDVLDANAKRSFIEPLQDLQDTELKEIRFQLKKLNGRRLDLDYKQRRSVPAQEVRQASDKFLSSRDVAERSMFLLLQNDADRLARLAALVAALLEFHRHAHHILLGLHGNLQARLTAASNKPRRWFRKIRVRGECDVTSAASSGDQVTVLPWLPSRPGIPTPCYMDRKLILDQPCCRALYSFHRNHEGELSFGEGDVILLTCQVDAHWFEGELGGRSGLVPISYVDVLVPLPLP